MNTLRAIAPLAAAGLLASAAVAQPPRDPNNLLDRTRALQEVTTQKLEAEVRRALDDARKLLPADPDRAAVRLRAMLLKLDSEALLAPADRRRLTGQLEQALAAVGKRGQVPAAAPGAREKDARHVAERFRAEQLRGQAAQIRKDIDAIAGFQRDGRFVEAEQLAAHLARRFPDNPAAQAMARRTSMAERVREARALLAEQEKRIDLALRSIEEAAIPPKDDVEFPEDWKERTARRTQTHLTEKEKAILKALDQPVTLNLENVPFTELIQGLSDKMGQPILINKADLAAADVRSDTPVSVRLRNVSMRTALRQILQEKGLTFVVRDEAIQVVSQLKARELMVTRVYYLGDLVSMSGPFGGAVTWGPYLDRLQTLENAQIIMDMIKNSVDPHSWEPMGNGTIRFHLPTLSIVVRQTAEVHSLLESKFAK